MNTTGIVCGVVILALCGAVAGHNGMSAVEMFIFLPLGFIVVFGLIEGLQNEDERKKP